MRMKIAAVTGILLLVAGLVIFAQTAKPNFSGTWNLDKAKSGISEGENVRGAAATLVIEHKEPNLVIQRKMGDRATEEKYTTDGKPSTNPGFREGSTSQSTVQWDGGKLVMATTSETPNGAMTNKSTYSLSADGQALTIETSRNGEARKFVYTK